MSSALGLVREKIQKEHEKELNHLAEGLPREGTAEAYREVYGYLRGLRAALTFCEIVERDME
jgi:hypothetical protein